MPKIVQFHPKTKPTLITLPQRKCRVIANAIMRALFIDNTDSLIGLIGNGNESCNKEAIINWLSEQQLTPDQAASSTIAALLVQELEKALENMRDHH